MRPDLGEAVENPPRDVDSGGHLREGCGHRRSDDSGQAVDDLEKGGGLREDERLLHGGVDGFVAGFRQCLDG